VLIQEGSVTRDASISDAEWQVMEAAWSLGEATAAAIIEELAKSTAWNHRTIRTLLGRLVEKGVLEKQGQGAGSVYRALVPRRARVRSEGRSFLKRMFQGDATSLLLHFAKEAKLDPAKLARLRELLDDGSGESNQENQP
jgi:BlaI family penicillinase repressor